MHVLRAFADSHPLNRLSTVLGVTLRNEDLCKRVTREFATNFQNNPTVVTKPLFWEGITKSIKEHWHYQNFGIRNPKNMRWEIPRSKEVAAEFEIIRRIYEDQFNRLREHRFNHVYHEGLGIHPLKSYATRLLRLGFQDLDKRQYKGYLTPEQQRERERQDWIPVIRPDSSVKYAVMVAGRNHIYGDYDLPGALEEMGIHLQIEVDYKKFGLEFGSPMFT